MIKAAQKLRGVAGRSSSSAAKEEAEEGKTAPQSMRGVLWQRITEEEGEEGPSDRQSKTELEASLQQHNFSIFWHNRSSAMLDSLVSHFRASQNNPASVSMHMVSIKVEYSRKGHDRSSI